MLTWISIKFSSFSLPSLPKASSTYNFLQIFLFYQVLLHKKFPKLEMKKVVLKLDLHDDKCRQKAMKTASGLSGVDSIALDKDQKLTITGDIDPVAAARKLKKICHTEIISVGPTKEPEKKKEEPKKPADPKIEPPKENAYVYHPQMSQYYYPVPDCYTHGKSVEEDPNGCVIC